MENEKWQRHVWFRDGGFMHKLKSNLGVSGGVSGIK